MKVKQERYEDDDMAVTNALGPKEIVNGSSYGDVTWDEWCDREMARIHAVGNGVRVRIARGDGRMWLTRG